MGKPKNQTKKGGRKIGRNKVKCARYAAQGRKERNKARKAAKHQRAHPRDRGPAGDPSGGTATPGAGTG